MTADLELLRRAAGRMRELAKDALLAGGDDPWGASSISWNNVHGTVYPVDAGQVNICDASTEELAEHIAAWHPAVALAVADLLDLVIEAVANAGDIDWFIRTSPTARRALAVARAFLGEAS